MKYSKNHIYDIKDRRRIEKIYVTTCEKCGNIYTLYRKESIRVCTNSKCKHINTGKCKYCDTDIDKYPCQYCGHDINKKSENYEILKRMAL